MKSLSSIQSILMGISIGLLLLAAFGSRAGAQSHDVAIKGYDSVAYFKDSRALKGNESFSFQWHDMTWYFVTRENMNLFAANPEKYTPQYDGWCAWAMTDSRKAVTNPEIWKIVDGKLYLQCSASAMEKWNRDIPGNIKKADENWLNLKEIN
jgi:hypothetical protein